MKTSRIIAILVWVYVIVSTIGSPVYMHQASANFLALNGESFFVLLFPPIVAGASAFFMQRHPFDAPWLRAKVDDKFGVGVYAGFLLELKPLLLFGTSGVLACLVQGYLAYSPSGESSYFLAGFMGSAGVSFFLMHVILAKRGISLEPTTSAAPWAGQDFLPSSIRRIRATKTTAALTGVWTAIGMMGFEAFSAGQKSDSGVQTISFIVCAIFFFFIPTSIFVLGIQNQLDALPGETFFELARRRVGSRMIRGFCWLFGAAMSSIAMSLIEQFSL